MIHSPSPLLLLKAWIYEILFKVKYTIFCQVAFALHLQYFQSPWAQYGPIILRMSFVYCCCSLPEFIFPPLNFHNYCKTSVTAGQKAPSLQRRKYFAQVVQEARSRAEHCSLYLVLSVSENCFPVEIMPLQECWVWKNESVSGCEALKL